jgi:hypothetical protein
LSVREESVEVDDDDLIAANQSLFTSHEQMHHPDEVFGSLDEISQRSRAQSHRTNGQNERYSGQDANRNVAHANMGNKELSEEQRMQMLQDCDQVGPDGVISRGIGPHGHARTFPAQDGSLPDQNGSLTGKDRSLPGQGRLVPGQNGLLSGQGGSLTVQGGSLPGQGGSLPGQGGSLPGQAGSLPGQNGPLPGQAGSLPGQGVSLPGQGGSLPGQGGSLPGQAGSLPGQNGPLPGQGGSLPGQNGILSEPGKIDHNHVGSLSVQTGKNSLSTVVNGVNYQQPDHIQDHIVDNGSTSYICVKGHINGKHDENNSCFSPYNKDRNNGQNSPFPSRAYNEPKHSTPYQTPDRKTGTKQENNEFSIDCHNALIQNQSKIEHDDLMEGCARNCFNEFNQKSSSQDDNECIRSKMNQDNKVNSSSQQSVPGDQFFDKNKTADTLNNGNDLLSCDYQGHNGLSASFGAILKRGSQNVLAGGDTDMIHNDLSQVHSKSADNLTGDPNIRANMKYLDNYEKRWKFFIIHSKFLIRILKLITV